MSCVLDLISVGFKCCIGSYPLDNIPIQQKNITSRHQQRPYGFSLRQTNAIPIINNFSVRNYMKLSIFLAGYVQKSQARVR